MGQPSRPQVLPLYAAFFDQTLLPLAAFVPWNALQGGPIQKKVLALFKSQPYGYGF
jgi:hypothetical protein